MKWLGGGEGDGIIKVEMDRGPHRTQDDAAVGYVFQRAPDTEFPSFGPKQLRWAHGDDSIIDQNHDKWKYPVVNNKVDTPPNTTMSYMAHQQQQQQQHNPVHQAAAAASMPGLYDMSQHNKTMGAPPPEHLVYMTSNQMAANQMAAGIALHHHHHPLPQQYAAVVQQQLQQAAAQQQAAAVAGAVSMRQHQQPQQQIAPSAKKLWGLEAKDAKSLALNHLNHEGVWRDPTWAAPVEHAVSAPLAMGRRGGGGFVGAGNDTGSILSPRGSDNGGLGVKMVEYVLGTSPTGKDMSAGGLEPRMRVLHLEDKDKDKGQSTQSPKMVNDVEVNGGGVVVQQQVVQNGVQMCDDDKGFNRTPGSRQPSPAEEELTKNGITIDHNTLVQLKQQQEAHLPPHLHHLPPHLAPHLGVTLAESVNQQFEHFASASEQVQQQQSGGYDQQQHQQYAPPPPQPHQVDSAVLQQQQHNFDVQVSEFVL